MDITFIFKYMRWGFLPNFMLEEEGHYSRNLFFRLNWLLFCVKTKYRKQLFKQYMLQCAFILHVCGKHVLQHAQRQTQLLLNRRGYWCIVVNHKRMDVNTKVGFLTQFVEHSFLQLFTAAAIL